MLCATEQCLLPPVASACHCRGWPFCYSTQHISRFYLCGQLVGGVVGQALIGVAVTEAGAQNLHLLQGVESAGRTAGNVGHLAQLGEVHSEVGDVSHLYGKRTNRSVSNGKQVFAFPLNGLSIIQINQSEPIRSNGTMESASVWLCEYPLTQH